MTNKEYKELSRRITWLKFKYLCTRKSRCRIEHNASLRVMKTLICFNIENFRNNRHLKLSEL